MKKVILSAIVFVFALSAQTDVSGIWNGKAGQQSAKYGTIPTPMQLTLLQAGTNVTGTVKIGNGNPFSISKGSVSGTTLTLFMVTPQGTSGTATLSFSVSQLTGTLTTSTGGSYTLALTKYIPPSN